MPLQRSKSPEAFSSNVKAEMQAGKPQAQSLAIAYAVKRKAQRKGYSEGGEIRRERLKEDLFGMSEPEMLLESESADESLPIEEAEPETPSRIDRLKRILAETMPNRSKK